MNPLTARAITVAAAAVAATGIAACGSLEDYTRHSNSLEAHEIDTLKDLTTAYNLCVVYNAVRIDSNQAPEGAQPSDAEATTAALEAVANCSRNYELIEDYIFDLRLDIYSRKELIADITPNAIDLAETSVNEVRKGEEPAYVEEYFAEAGKPFRLIQLTSDAWDKFETGWKSITPKR